MSNDISGNFRVGVDISNFSNVDGTRLLFVERSMGFTQLASRHRLRRLHDLELRWQGNASWVARSEPDTRSLRYEQLEGEAMRYIDQAGSGERFFSDLDESGLGTGLDASLPLGRITLSAGGSVQHLDRSFAARRFRFSLRPGGDRMAKFLPPDEIFSAEQIGANFELAEETHWVDAYDATQLVTAGYSGAGLELGQRVRLVGGARYEVATQKLTPGSPNAIDMDTGKGRVDRTDRSWVPSSSAVVSLTRDMNLRLAYSYTLARPRFRELASFSFTDYTRDVNITGEPTLVQSRIHNADLRWEWFLGDTDVLAASLFYKRFRDPIEAVVFPTGDLGFDNAESARAIGAELEARLSLGVVAAALREVRLWSNATLSRTRIELSADEVRSQSSASRALQGQAPVVLNVGASWSHRASGSELTALYNVVGRRIEAVGINGLPDAFREPAHQLDLAASQELGDDLTLKLGASNLLNQSEILRQGGFDVYRQSPGVAVSAALEWAP